jgi:hypothetical protein
MRFSPIKSLKDISASRCYDVLRILMHSGPNYPMAAPYKESSILHTTSKCRVIVARLSREIYNFYTKGKT